MPLDIPLLCLGVVQECGADREALAVFFKIMDPCGQGKPNFGEILAVPQTLQMPNKLKADAQTLKPDYRRQLEDQRAKTLMATNKWVYNMCTKNWFLNCTCS